ncbi:MAG TPA: SMC family ATPase [candidate division Zixibacteria bacterium]|nr:SMC family ATPase [candidate division Zixibacteria bacterium]
MILRTLKLENIRSYAEQTVLFPMGTTLFEGDIGSGKSTILMAIEFALFGLGSEKGGALLKVGMKKGMVSLCFEVEGKEYEVCRSLERKAKSVQQSDCSLKTDGSVLQLSASEMKEKVLDILAFNEPADPKAQSVIYRYAIFTSQEEMKAIIWMRADARLQTLRKAFRIEDYRIALENCSTLAKSIKEKSIRLASHASDLGSRREKRDATRAEIGKCGQELEVLSGNRDSFGDKVNALREKFDSLQKSKEALGKAVGEVPLLEKQIKEKNGEVVSLEGEAEELSADLGELQREADGLSKIPQPTPKTGAELKEELESIRRKERQLRSAEDVIGAKINDYESVEENGVCPTCDRPADPAEFEDKIKLKQEEKLRASEEVATCETRIKEIETLQESLRQYETAQDKLQNLTERMEGNRERIEKHREKILALKRQVEEAREKLQKAQQEVGEYNRILGETAACSKELDEIRSQLDIVKSKISKFQTTRDILANQVEELEKEIRDKEKERKTAERMKEYQMWLEEFWMPTLEAIEKYVMMNINQEFNQHFQKWWGMLVEDPSKESRIDEDFTPTVEQDGYEQDYNYLSGGEKTSLALAYRLSLNTIVQKVSAGIKSNLLILDEPTDGFSKEQLFKIREILDELKCPQVVMVSHERELESFADQVMRVEKKDGVSQIKVI